MEITRINKQPEYKMYSFQHNSHSKKQPDFLGRNRRAVRDAGRDGERRGRAGPGVRQQTRTREQEQKKVSSDTVEISKSYLERLLQMAVAPQSVAPQSVVPQSVAPQSSTAAHEDTNEIPGYSSIMSAPHIHPERCQVPGLSFGHNTSKYHQTQCHTQQPLAQQRKNEREEDYSPWGRPGGGAPIRTVSGTLLTNYSTRGQEVEDMRSAHQKQTSTVVSSETGPPHTMVPPYKSPFVRGMGPHVDTFVLSQREEQRRKDLCHKEELAAQIAERQRQREAEQQKREREERETEERVRRELEEINRRTERERERRQRKAEEERACQAMLQARIQEAEATAIREKTQRSQQIRETGEVCRRAPHRRPGDPHREPATRKPVPVPHSRIPLPISRKPPHKDTYYLATQRSKVVTHQHPPYPPPVARPTAGQQPSYLTTQSHPPYPRPPAHPPYPPAHPPYPQPPAHPPYPPAHPPPSPVVPALAKRLARQAPTQLTQPHTTTVTQPPVRPPSPVVPALAKRLARQAPTQLTQPHTTTVTQPPVRPPSPIVPALAKKLARQVPTQPHTTSLVQPSTTPSLPLITHTTKLDTNTSSSIPIHRPPFCQPSTHSPRAPDHLPTLTPSLQHTGKLFPTQPPQSVARQQTILHQLAILREGIVSQRKSLDHRLQNLSSVKAMTHS